MRKRVLIILAILFLIFLLFGLTTEYLGQTQQSSNTDIDDNMSVEVEVSAGNTTTSTMIGPGKPGQSNSTVITNTKTEVTAFGIGYLHPAKAISNKIAIPKNQSSPANPAYHTAPNNRTH